MDSQIDSRLRTSLEALTGGKLVKRQVDQTLDSQVDIFAEANKYRFVFIRPYTQKSITPFDNYGSVFCIIETEGSIKLTVQPSVFRFTFPEATFAEVASFFKDRLNPIPPI